MKSILILVFVIALIALSPSGWAGGICGPAGSELANKIPDTYRARSANSKKSVQFWRACKVHDACYDNRALSKQHCDNRFLTDLRKECKNTYGGFADVVPYGECMSVAQSYYETMKAFTDRLYDR